MKNVSERKLNMTLNVSNVFQKDTEHVCLLSAERWWFFSRDILRSVKPLLVRTKSGQTSTFCVPLANSPPPDLGPYDSSTIYHNILDALAEIFCAVIAMKVSSKSDLLYLSSISPCRNYDKKAERHLYSREGNTIRRRLDSKCIHFSAKL